MEWFEGIFKKTNEYPVDELVCMRGKNPSPQKKQDYCTTCDAGAGCSNLISQSYFEFKPDEDPSKRNRKPKKKR